MKFARRVSLTGLLSLVASLLLTAPSDAQTIGGYQQVSAVRFSRTVDELTYRATLTNNTGAGFAGATATVTSLSPATTIMEGSLTFGPVGPGGTVVSFDTFVFRQDRTVPFSFANLRWTIQTTPANRPPVANAGPDQTVSGIGATVTLDGTGSSDVDGQPLTFAWTFVSKPAGSTTTLTNPTAVHPTFVVDRPGTYQVQLIVNDGFVNSAPDVVAITSQNSPPTANAGPDQAALVGNTVTLNGSASSDVDGNPLTFAWSFVSRPAGSTAVLNNPTAVSPTFVVDVTGDYVVQLIVHDGIVNSAPDTVAISTQNSAPVANAGPDQTVLVTQTVTLDGTGSSDVDGQPLTFAWTFVSKPAGSTTTLTNPTTVHPTFVADRPGTYQVQLIVNDGFLNSAPDVVTITSQNSPPTANAGPDQAALVGDTVTLNGSASSDVDGNPLTFAWSFVSRPAGSTAVLNNPTAVSPTFVVDVTGDYVVQLIVNDGFVNSAPDTVAISTQNSAPVANAGPDQTVLVTQTVTLDGTGSSDVNGQPLTFAWTFVSKPAGSTTTLTNPTTVHPTFIADRPGTYQVQLIVNDGFLNSAPDVVAITTQNSPPVANAGPDQSVFVTNTVTLDGSGSTDVDGNVLTYSWSLTSTPAGSTAILSNPAAVSPTFVADKAGTYVAQLVVNDGLVTSAADTVMVTTQNTAPVANAGPDQTVVAGQLVLLNGSASSDVDGNSLTFQWSFTSRPAGSTATLTNPTSIGPSFTADRPGTYVVQLIVNDGTVGSAPDTVVITTTNSTPVANAGPDQLAVPVGSLVQLDGTLSSDADSHVLTYQWSLLSKPAGSGAVLSSLTAVNPMFTADLVGDYVAQLIVNDGFVDSAPDTVLIRAVEVTLPVVTIDATDAVAAEPGLDTGTFTISRTGPTDNALTVVYSVAGAATNGTDYAPVATSVVIPAGAPGSTIAITPLDDTINEGSEDVVLTLVADPSYTVGAPGLAAVTIADDDGNVLTATATVADASEAGPTPGTITFSRTGDTSAALSFTVARGGTAAESDYSGTGVGASFLVTIPAGQTFVDVTITPLRDNLVEGAETVVLTVAPGPGYTVGTPDAATVTIADDPAVVNITTIDTDASEAGGDTGAVTFARSGGDLASALTVSYSIGGTATNNVDYALIGGSITIPANVASASRTIAPLADNSVESPETVILTITASASYNSGTPDSGTVTIADSPAIVTVTATDPDASEVGPDSGVFTFTRIGGDLSSPLQVFFARAGTASEGTDYANIGVVVTIAATETSATLTITPTPDALTEGDETVALTINANASYTIGTSGTASLTIHDTTTAPIVTVMATDAAASEVGPDAGVFRFTRTGSTTSALTVSYNIGGGATNGTDYTAIASTIIIPVGQVFVDRTITPIVDAAAEGSETVVITVTDTPDYDPGAPSSATVTIADVSGDCVNDGGVLVNGAMHCGTISNPGETDSWTFTANAGDRIAVHIGETVDNNDFRPWIRLSSPTGASLADTAGTAAAAISDVVAPVTGTYLLRVASFDSGFDGTGTYRLTMTHTPGPITVSPGDEGGPLTNGAIHTGEILRGDVDVWTFTATAGDRIALHIGEITDTADFRPWIRLWTPTGGVVGDRAGVDADAIEGVAPVTGTYLVLVSSFDSGFDGTGTYRLTMTHTPGPITVSPGDQGGPLTNGSIHTGEIIQGDVDVWTFTANMGERIALHIGETSDTDDFRPWIRLWAPTGAVVGDRAGVDADAIEGVAPVTGTYLVLVSSFDSGFDGTGTYRLEMTHTPGPITISPGDQGGPLTNGAVHTGEIVQGDIDVWTFAATAGDRIALHIGETLDTDDFRPWIRLWAPTGAVVGDRAGVDADAIEAVAPVTGTYFVLVSSFDSGFDGTGTYRLEMTHTPGPITISPGDQGGPLTNGAIHTGEIVQGDVDVWTFTANMGERIALHISETSDTDDFRPWIRLWAPTGGVVGDRAGVKAEAIEAVAPVTGTYFVLVSSFDSGFDGTGTYRLEMFHTPGPITLSPGDQGGPLTNGAIHTGEIVQGDVDVWTFAATAGDRIGLHIGEITDTADFRPWIRLWAPTGAVVGDQAGVSADAIEAVAPVTGTYFVLVSSFDSGFDGTGTYRLETTHTPGPITISPGDQGGPLTNGAIHTGEIVQGDVDVWTFAATAGDRIGLHIGEITDTADFRPWIRLWAPTGAVVGDQAGVSADAIEAVAPVTGTYLVLVSSFDSGFDGTGTYRLTMTHTPGPITVSPGDEGGPLTNGAIHTGEILQGDLDVWTITAVAGQHITVQISQTSETDDFRPWIRLWAPNGATLGNVAGVDTASINSALAPATGSYLVLVSTFDGGFDGTGTYNLTVTSGP